MILRSRYLRLRLFQLPLLFTVGVLLACGTGETKQTVGERRLHRSSQYHDFKSADSLSAYLRSDALPLIGAHRGGPTDKFPENAIRTFTRSLSHGPVLLEVDVRMTKDSVLVLMHDETLNRTTTGEGDVDSHTLLELRKLRLVTASRNTSRYQVPTLAEALAWAEGRAVLQLDVKQDVPRTLVTDLLRRLNGLDQALVITYTLEDARWYHERLPDLLLSVSTETKEEAIAHINQIETSRLIAFAGVGEPSQDVLKLLSNHNVPVAVGTFGDLDQRAQNQGLSVYRSLLNQGVDIIATDEISLASQAANTYRPQAADSR